MSERRNIGIDVSQDGLDVAIRPGGTCFCVSNNAAGWAELASPLRCFPIAAIGLEPSGGYERGVTRVLLAADVSVRRINPAAPVRPCQRQAGKKGPHRRSIRVADPAANSTALLWSRRALTGESCR